MIFDMEKKKLYRDLVDWVECVCPVEDCYNCPISHYNNGKECCCSKFVELYPDNALRLLRDRVKEVQNEAEAEKELEKMVKEDMKDMENVENAKENQMGVIEENAPPLCRLLGVQPYQAFSYEDEDYRVFAIDENGVRYELETEIGWSISYDEENLVKLIQHPEKVARKGDAQGLRDLARMQRAKEKLKKILPGTEAVTEFEGKVYAQVVTKKNIFELVEVDLEALE